jgi:hypothetical protein
MNINRQMCLRQHTVQIQPKEYPMKLLTDLFSTDYGLMSIGGIFFMLGMGVFFLRFFSRKMEEDAKAAGK